MNLETAFLTDKGRKRTNNEDRGIVLSYDLTNRTTGLKLLLIAIADGIGGHLAGERASEDALGITKRAFLRLSGSSNDENELIKIFTEQLSDIFESANRGVTNFAEVDPECKGMGTTLTICAIINRRAIFGNIGDSRAYLIRDGAIRRVTKDHSFVQNLIDIGEITEDEAFSHPQRNIVTKFIGCGKAIKADIFSEDLKQGDVVLLCSDGLHDMLRDEQILKCIADGMPMADLARNLVDTANRLGGVDNITVAVARIKD